MQTISWMIPTLLLIDILAHSVSIRFLNGLLLQTNPNTEWNNENDADEDMNMPNELPMLSASGRNVRSHYNDRQNIELNRGNTTNSRPMDAKVYSQPRGIFNQSVIARRKRFSRDFSDSESMSAPLESILAPSPFEFPCPWSTWSEWSSCGMTCGSCSVKTRTRLCDLTSPYGCECSGPHKQSDTCGRNVCLHPWRSCCYGFKVESRDNQLICSLA
ncbi:hypothetical protein AB6A40_009897 [Gnathostoma spinigerum]|uniref:Uncharacterized protein n=1 Tax=Gnathostoma spinigerum TaxID=75299 RepID=A0ABD6F0S3_9BILA